MNKVEYEPVIGLEVHVQLKTSSKVFCGCSTVFGAPPNTQTCPVCLGLPGVLPVLNKQALIYAIKTALAFNCQINTLCKFDRKNYYYPDLPKNYQISQYDLPIAEHGYIGIIVDGKVKKINIKRIHLEEDAGKLIHSSDGSASYVDYNRAGIPLLEIVSEPEIFSPEEAYEYLLTLKQIIRYLDVSDCNMEEGSLRCDANISLRPKGSTGLGVKTEIKNMNSFKAVSKALAYEITRQKKILDDGRRIIQETRLWNPDREITISMRSKEEAHDYRYFPEPDLVPLSLEPAFVEQIKESIPELPYEKRRRFVEQYNLPEYDARVLTATRPLADYYESTVKHGGNPKLISNWVMSELLRELNLQGIDADESPVSSENLSKLVQLIENKTISGKIAKEIFAEMYKTGKDPEAIIKEKSLVQITDESVLDKIIEEVIQQNPKSVTDYRNGKTPALLLE